MAALLSLALFTFLWLIGFALLHLIGTRRNLLRNALLAPAAGAAAIVLPLFTLFRLNYPVKKVAWILAVLLVAGVAGVWWRVRPVVPIRRMKPFLIVLAIAFLLTGYPLLLYGFNWLSYANDDMAGYVLAAHRFVDHGFYDVPDKGALLDNRDAGANYWFSYAIEGARCGSELVLAWVISLTGLTGYQIYMPVILTWHLGLISSLGALILRNRHFRLAAVTSCAWLAVSSQNTLGTMYQLMPQVFGVMLLIASGVILLQPFRFSSTRQQLRLALLAGVLVSALAVVYYEIMPFLPVAFVGYHVLQLLRRRENVRSVIMVSLVAIIFAALALRTWMLSAALLLGFQAGRSLTGQDVDASIFPYYLVPSGLANLWGFVPIGMRASNGLLNLGIVGGGILLLVAAAASAWEAWRGEAVAVFSLVMLLLGLRLFIGNGDFGLFKLAMYIQPFLLSSIVLSWFRLTSRWNL